MHLGAEGETLFFQYDHFVMALEITMHELYIHKEELGSILEKAVCTRFWEVGRGKGLKQDSLNTIKVVIGMLSHLRMRCIRWGFFLSKFFLNVGPIQWEGFGQSETHCVRPCEQYQVR